MTHGYFDAQPPTQHDSPTDSAILAPLLNHAAGDLTPRAQEAWLSHPIYAGYWPL